MAASRLGPLELPGCYADAMLMQDFDLRRAVR